MARRLRAAAVLAGRHGSLAWRLGVPRHHGGRKFLGVCLAWPPRPRAAQGAHAAALPAGTAAPGQAPDGHLPAALARLVRAHGARPPARLVQRAGLVADPRSGPALSRHLAFLAGAEGE